MKYVGIFTHEQHRTGEAKQSKGAAFQRSALQTQILQQAACLGFQFVLGLPIRERNAAEWREDKGIWASNFTLWRSQVWKKQP